MKLIEIVIEIVKSALADLMDDLKLDNQLSLVDLRGHECTVGGMKTISFYCLFARQDDLRLRWW